MFDEGIDAFTVFGVPDSDSLIVGSGSDELAVVAESASGDCKDMTSLYG